MEDEDLARRHALDVVAIRFASAGNVGGTMPPGVLMLDSWVHERYAGVLFWADGGEFDVWGKRMDPLHHVSLERSEDGTWTVRGWNGVSSERPRKFERASPRGFTGAVM